ncbi:MAG: TetR family transcriptional regulator [Acidobacteria bacterium CG_4_9_14_3_um_filter_49_7]|nr:MAG: TetR family transcriptional regulator [Acidobacteria bacterium CG_4_9_14_3_um_filter_49_7]
MGSRGISSSFTKKMLGTFLIFFDEKWIVWLNVNESSFTFEREVFMKLKKEEKRNKIIHAAIRIFARNGYFNSRVSEIAKEAGVADGTIYIYFKSKNEILSAIFDEALDKFVRVSEDKLKSIFDPIERLEMIAFLHLQYLGANRDLATVFQIEFRHNIVFMEKFTRSKLRDYFNIIRETIETGQEKNIFRQLDSKFGTKLFFGMIDEMVTSWLLSKKEYQLENSAKSLTHAFVFGLAEC